MNVHYLQHAPTEGPGYVAKWAAEHGYVISATHWYHGDAAPEPASIDLLVIMGGGMNIYQHREHPWLVAEKELISKVIGLGKPTLGICLGAQLVADVLGAKVYQNAELEIGWFPVETRDGARRHPFFSHFPDEFIPLHWHGDTFSLPAGATLIASSDACENQAFIHGRNVVGLQFHAEVCDSDVRTFVGAETEPLPEGRYVQSFEQIIAGIHYTPGIHRLLAPVLDHLAATF